MWVRHGSLHTLRLERSHSSSAWRRCRQYSPTRKGHRTAPPRRCSSRYRQRMSKADSAMGSSHWHMTKFRSAQTWRWARSPGLEDRSHSHSDRRCGWHWGNSNQEPTWRTSTYPPCSRSGMSMCLWCSRVLNTLLRFRRTTPSLLFFHFRTPVDRMVPGAESLASAEMRQPAAKSR
jgi:hypothetical protein